ncbi:MAG: LytTR family DNA-binding domain-containing protein [Lachnospiraceae bacterium]|jgi:DNA-binding LytR/AlgR family response regulator|nr:LytTR family DNA-binding domain-containing protein [Lachnospiraceae bacterium]
MGINMIKIAVCDDNKFITDKIEELLKENLLRKKIVNYTVDIYNSSQNLLNYINGGNDYDLIYMDIEMPEIDGIRLAAQIRKNNREFLLIYVSSYDNYFVELFPLSTFRFLRKPINEQHFEQVFDAVCDELNRRNCQFSYEFGGNLYRIPLSDIFYFESVGHSVFVVTKNKKDRFRGKLDNIEKQLEGQQAQFVRIHQSYLANLAMVKEVYYEHLIMNNDILLRISQDRRKKLRKIFVGISD